MPPTPPLLRLGLALLLCCGSASSSDEACPPRCPEVGFVDELREAGRAAGLAIPAPPADVLAHLHTRPATDRHFYKQVVAAQLANAGPISRSAVDSALGVKRVNKYQIDIANGRIYRTAACMFGPRCKGVEHFLWKSLPTLRKRRRAQKSEVIELAINVRDWPQAVDGVAGTPVLSFSKRSEAETDIMFPAWAFWDGGPWLPTIPTWQWPTMRRELTETALATPWESKEPVVFFRGSRTSPARDPFVLKGHARRGHRAPPGAARWNVRYVKNQSQKSNDIVTEQLGLDFSEPAPMPEHCRYKYLLNFDGQAASFRYKTLFLCGSLVLSVDLQWEEFWYEYLIPWVHYVPLAADGSDGDAVLDFLEAHPEEAKAIAENGRQFVLQRLRMQDVQGAQQSHLPPPSS